MRINVLAICPPKCDDQLREVTPELLASSLAKYSRSNKGIDSILETIDWNDPDASVDKIFKFVDYGHASIGGMTGGIAITIDDCSMFLAYKIFEISSMVDGQESSTRYIKMSEDSLIDPNIIGIPDDKREEWYNLMKESYRLYNEEYSRLDKIAKDNPEVMNIPIDTPEKIKDRIRKNYALDRARYFIPLATKTSAAYVMTARVWADTIKQLASLPIKECKIVADMIRTEVAKVAPRLMKHSYPDNASIFQARRMVIGSYNEYDNLPVLNIKDKVWTEVYNNTPSFLDIDENIHDDFSYKLNRYSNIGYMTKRMTAKFAFNNIAIAELRDLNRHRTGYKYTSFKPIGFYLPNEIDHSEYYPFLIQVGKNIHNSYKNKKCSWKSIDNKFEDEFFMYSYLLGHQVNFEHTTQFDKVIYEIELRTGLGAHFRYAEHMKNVALDIIDKNKIYHDYINIGTAEPE